MVTSLSRVAKLEIKILQSFCVKVDSPVSLSCWLLAEHGEFSQLVEKKVNPANYMNADAFSLDYQCASMLSKSAEIPTGIDVDRVAFSKYLSCEQSCKDFNDSFDNRLRDHTFLSLLEKVRLNVKEILGPLDKGSISFFLNESRFGPGSTTTRRRSHCYSEKLGPGTLEVTSRALDYALFGLPHVWKDLKPCFSVSEKSKVVFVPKTSKTSRVIEVQPDLNIYFQLGVGSLLRSRLKRIGIDLLSQDLNRSMAFHGSFNDSYSTIDLSSASDTIAWSLVNYLLPNGWRELLEDLRVPIASHDGSDILLQKWSAMGNGYTFELETLIFVAVVRSVGVTDFSVYGDDIIVPNSSFAAVSEALSLMGFSLNKEKSFGTGLFRESCGLDAFDGHNVRPFFLRKSEKDSSYASICYTYGNSIREWCRRNSGTFRKEFVHRAWLACFTSCPPNLRFRTPLGFGGGFHSDFDEACPLLKPHKRSEGWGGFTFKYLGVYHTSRRPTDLLTYLSTLMGKTHKEPFGEETRPTRTKERVFTGYSLEWLSTWF